MIISVTGLRNQIDCGTATDEQITVKLEAIESVIRAYTNNNFQQRGIRFAGSSEGQSVYGSSEFFTVNDTVQISGSDVNDGLYVVVVADKNHIELDRPLMTADYNLVTKIKYPADVIQCAIDMYKWKQNMSEKVGIKSETISRHSVTYEDSATLYMGYPLGILSGLNLYKKARC
jgi:hypothetical protein